MSLMGSLFSLFVALALFVALFLPLWWILRGAGDGEPEDRSKSGDSESSRQETANGRRGQRLIYGAER